MLGRRFLKQVETTLKLPPRENPRLRVFAITIWLAIAFNGLGVLQSAASDMSALLAVNAFGGALACVSLYWLKAETPARAARLLLWNLVITLPIGSLATTPMEATMLGYLFVVPLISATMLTHRETKRWLFRVIVAGVFALIAAKFELTAPQTDSFPWFTKVFNYVGTIAATMGLLLALSRESRRANQRMLEAERAKSAFFANIGHEIRTPMNGVLGMTDALLQRQLPSEERDMVSTIRSSGGLMLALLDDLLDLSKLEAGRLLLHEHPVSLPALADELRLLWAPMAAKKGLTLNVWLDAQLPPTVLLDGRRLRQIAGNLLSNALKFTEKGSVTLHLEAAGHLLTCTVEDTGIGIAPEQRERLFSRFVQADDARARRYQGAGLGLALSRDLAELMRGTLTVTSVPGLGSRFTCTVPLVPVAHEAEKAQPKRELPPGLRVLVVDDNAVNRLVAQRLLDRTGCSVEVAVDGRSALTALEQPGFDLVLMDVHMPDMDGLEVTRRLRARGDQRVRIIGVSASAESEDVQNCRDAGMNDFLAKPMTSERLVETLLRQLAK